MTWWRKIAENRPPDFFVGDQDAPHMLRWYVVPRNRLLNVYLHRIVKSDADQELHDHMYPSLSYILQGAYVEHTIMYGGVHKKQLISEGEWKLRGPWFAHRIELLSGTEGACWSLFVTGPRVRGTWGFYCKDAWRPWREFVGKRKTGGGCS